jgi:hypothetical protein
MNIGDIGSGSTQSLKQAINIASIRKTMNQDALAVSSIMNSITESSAKVMENSVTPHKGGTIDVRV